MNLYPQSYGQPIQSPLSPHHSQSQSPPPLSNFTGLNMNGDQTSTQPSAQQPQGSTRFSSNAAGGWDGAKRASRQGIPQNWFDPSNTADYRNPSPALSPPTSNSSGPTSSLQTNGANVPYQSYQPYPDMYHAGAMGAIGLANTPSPPPMFSALPSGQAQTAPNISQLGMSMNGLSISSGVAAVAGGVTSNPNGMPVYGSASLANMGRNNGQHQQQQQGNGGVWQRAYAIPGMPIPDDDVIPTAIVIKNIPFAVPRETLLGVIESLGAPLPYAFNYHHDQGVFRGLAFANFRAPDEAAAVVAALNGYDVSGRKLKVEYKKVLQPGEKDRIEREKALKRMRSVQGFDRDMNGMMMGHYQPGQQQLSPSNSYGGITPSASLGGIGLSTLGSGVNVNQIGMGQGQGQQLPSGSGSLQRSGANGLSIQSNLGGHHGGEGISPGGLNSTGHGAYQQPHSYGASHNQGLATHFESDSPPQSAHSTDSQSKMQSSSSNSSSKDLPTELDMNDPITLDIYSRVLLFKEDRMRDEFAFSRNLTAYERRVVHLVANRLGMTSLTQGDDDNGKYVLVLRQPPAASSQSRPALSQSASSGPPASASAAFHSHHLTTHTGQGGVSNNGQMLPPNESLTAALRIKKSMPDLRGFNGPVISRDPAKSIAPQRSSGNLRAQAQAAQDAYTGYGGLGSNQNQGQTPGSTQGQGSGDGMLSPSSMMNGGAREFVSLGSASGRRVQINGTPTGWHSSSSSVDHSPLASGVNASANNGGNTPTLHSSKSVNLAPSRDGSASGLGMYAGIGSGSVSGASEGGVGREGALSPVSATGSASGLAQAGSGSGSNANLTRQTRGPAGDSRGFVVRDEAARTRESVDL